jgi:endonuclease YncB( thermonuclease family)
MTTMPKDEYALWAAYLSPWDGDSPHMRIFIPFNEDQMFAGRIRLARINCPEKSAPGGPEATAFTAQWIADGIAACPKRWKDWPFRVQGRIRERDGRPLVELWRVSDKRNLSDDLLANGHAATYPALLAMP